MSRRLVLILLIPLCESFAQTAIPSFYDQAEFLLAPSGALGNGLYGFDNPALLTHLRQPDVYFTWTDRYGDLDAFKHYGTFIAFPHFGFGFVRTRLPATDPLAVAAGLNRPVSVTDFRMAMGVGNRTAAVGLHYGWSTGDDKIFGRKKLISAGYLYRPMRYLSIGLTGSITTTGETGQVVGDLGIRPLGNEKLVVFADVVHQNKADDKYEYSAGALIELVPGIRLSFRRFSFDRTTVGLSVSLGHAGVSSQVVNHKNDSYKMLGVRLGAYDRNILRTTTQKNDSYLRLDLSRRVAHRTYRFFDSSTSLLELLRTIDGAQRDPAIGGVALNLSGISIDRSMAWELREKLRQLRASGKKVIVYIDRAGMDEYHLASTADHIVMDPFGILVLTGYVNGRTFVKGTLEKLGIGYHEWRFFKYKSASESFSRDRMSDADREQRQQMVDDWYETVRAEICTSRNLTSDAFDVVVNDSIVLGAAAAQHQGWIDTTGRWEDIDAVIRLLEGRPKKLTASRDIESQKLPYDDYWGEKPQIAVIYAVGECAMESGIRARSLTREVERAVRNPNIKAIVLRVDSPGGDAEASDWVAHALAKAKGKKPVVVSQGYVAASGGYWLSMNADDIVATPLTITGSIGVIGGWFYDRGLNEKVGFTTDYVKRGKHADIGFGARWPLLGIGLPDRNLDESEHDRVEHLIRSLYREFVRRVANARGMTESRVDSLGQGRVWTGQSAIRIGLVDHLGGLDHAIDIAARRAGLREYSIVEMPKTGWFAPDFLARRFVGFDMTHDPTLRHLRFRIERNGIPLPLLSLDDMETR